ncbi:MAG: uL22 family ribosomal protein, partial [Bacteroidota bacterium]
MDGEQPDEHDLYIKTAFADGGTQLKRFRPAPHGRAHRIRKRTCHATLVVENRIPTDGEKANGESNVGTNNDTADVESVAG